MRKIKFRVWDKEEKWMGYASSIFWARELHTVIYQKGREMYEKPVEMLELMQCTGIKDARGRDIYEGDIVRHKYGPQITMRVAWDDESPGFRTFGKHNGEPYVGYVKSSCEVIGNICENPELLEAQNV